MRPSGDSLDEHHLSSDPPMLISIAGEVPGSRSYHSSCFSNGNSIYRPKGPVTPKSAPATTHKVLLPSMASRALVETTNGLGLANVSLYLSSSQPSKYDS
ncbi:unnamed protein product [Protopolystoma xenopodis]|uniref:Uncharacterized protein n=1 Tax=Protopolystoma xenopodis TaxID=117903 RepID=A0A448WMJ2_9PLAT|nr:unnamed protein product [Protopolystoma xenopodis]